MSRSVLSFALALALSALAQPDPADPTPLTAKTYQYPNGIPYQVDPVTSAIRGPQTGYNICNSTTQNQQSECQTSIANDIGDFCIWGPPAANETIADTEAIVVAYCSMSGFGTRLIPAGALQGVQVLKTDKYIQWAGFINQAMIDMDPTDYGGELDPHGADLRGNPLGGLMYSTAFSGSNSTYQQIMDWNVFVGGNFFCMTICNPASSSADQSAYCQNIYDRMGCSYNMPNNAQNGTFEVCDSAYKTPVGIYVTGGVTMTYSQPNSGAVDPPYTPVVPSSSNCVQYASTALYTSLPTITTSPPAATGTKGQGTGSSSAGGPSPTTNGASALGVSSVAGIVGTLFAIAFLS